MVLLIIGSGYIIWVHTTRWQYYTNESDEIYWGWQDGDNSRSTDNHIYSTRQMPNVTHLQQDFSASTDVEYRVSQSVESHPQWAIFGYLVRVESPVVRKESRDVGVHQ